jgi:hypothetical protein
MVRISRRGHARHVDILEDKVDAVLLEFADTDDRLLVRR